MLPELLTLVRHGQSEQNLAIEMLRDGQPLPPEMYKVPGWQFRLTDLGREQARLTGLWFQENRRSYDFHTVSPYPRASETAALLGLPKATWQVNDILRERDWGTFERLPLTDTEIERHAQARRDRKTDRSFWRPEDGESMAQASFRVDRFLSTLHRSDYRQVIVVTHGEAIWAFRMRIEHPTHERLERLMNDPTQDIKNCQIVEFSRVDPTTGVVGKYAGWMRSFCPSQGISPIDLEWRRVVWEKFSNEALLLRAQRYPRFFTP